jgi:hypothetical protein
MYNAGDFELNKTVYIPFNTFDATGASVTVTDLVAGDVKIHKNGGTTKRSSSAGVTVSIDFDSVTGGHLIAIDTSDDTDAGFYADGADYQIRLEGITVATKTLNPFIATFSIRNRSALMPTTAGRKIDVASTGEAGLDFDNVKDASSAKTLTNITVPTVSTLTNAPASNSDITAIKTQTDKMAFTTANQIDARVLTNSDKTGYTASTVSDKTGYSLSASQAGVTIGTVTSVTNAVNINSNTDITDILADTNQMQGKLPTNNLMGSSDKDNHDTDIDSIWTRVNTNLDVVLSTRSSHAAADIWSVSTRTITDKAGFSLTTTPPTAQQIWEYVTRTLTSSSGGATAQEVWEYATRALTEKTGFSISGTKQTLDSLNDVSESRINVQVSSALNTYDPPTKAELVERTLPTENYATSLNQTAILNAINSLNDITVSEILAGLIDGTYNLKEVLQVIVSVVAGTSYGGGTGNYIFRDLMNTLNRVDVTVDETDNRETVIITKDA